MHTVTTLSADDLANSWPLDFDELDELEADLAVLARDVLTGLPARSGTRR
ncbi:hypothetical protein JOF56_003696 [Kibdelosporangium banguiense]|uniref:FXSXX-COOH protein n=1 Tax=Kibdelosporangium banguiense TaxID=1365924 RepID=A0ABS4TFV9_9PSEU|nr:hypothetical protein [Kibdelosporangium banguiense]MBP2323311.1 hypothetical protein [Kibdelosporangium banguiense]